MSYVIVLEGPDNIGKTTLAEAIEDFIDVKKRIIFKHWGPNKTKAEGRKVMDKFIAELRISSDKIFICDRSPFGEFVYGKIFRDYDPFTYMEDMIDDINRLKTKFLFISFYADENTYAKFDIAAKKDEEKEYQRQHQAAVVSCGFINLLHTLRDILNMTRVIINCNNYESFDVRNEYILRMVNRFLDDKPFIIKNVEDYSHTIFSPDQNIFNGLELHRMRYKCGMYDTGVCDIGREHEKFSQFGAKYKRPTVSCGNIHNPRYIFIGEAPGYMGCGTYGIPFYGDKSGYIFYNTLAKLNILHSEIYVGNTVKCCPKGNDLKKYYDSDARLRLECVRRLRKELSFSEAPIIALGRVASNTMKMLHIKHLMVYHPTYYLYKGNPNEFIEQLREVLKL